MSKLHEQENDPLPRLAAAWIYVVLFTSFAVGGIVGIYLQ